MKIKTIVTVLLVAFILASCTPAAKVVPTETTLPTSAFTSIPPTPTSMTTSTAAPVATLATLGQPTGDLLEQVWSSTGDSNQFDTADGLAVDQQGNLYVMDSGNHRIQKFDSDGHLIIMWGSKGGDDGQFECLFICMLAVDRQGNVFVTDASKEGNARVEKFDSNGKFLTKWGSYGSKDAQFKSPFGLAVDSQGDVYVGDPGNYRVQKFDSEGNFLTKWGSSGFRNGQFSEDLADIAVDGQGNVYVTDRSNGFQKFDSNGQFLGQFEHCGDEKRFFSAAGVAVDAQDNVYVSDLSNKHICKYASNGQFLDWWDGFGSADGLLDSVGGIAVDQQGNLYVAEWFVGRVRKFRLP
jgi:DNA-binding beta-propeller fold protein YncE